MAEWHVTPDYIVNHWTDELFALMVDKLKERKELKPRPAQSDNLVSDKFLFQKASNMVEVKSGH